MRGLFLHLFEANLRPFKILTSGRCQSDALLYLQWAMIFVTELGDVDRIIDHLKLTFAAAKPPPSHVFEQVTLAAAEKSGEYFLIIRDHGERESIVFLAREARFLVRICSRVPLFMALRDY